MRLLCLIILYVCNIFVPYGLLAQDIIPKLSGNFIQGGLIFGKTTPGTQIAINGIKVRVSTDGEFIIGFGRDYPSITTLSATSIDGITSDQEITVKSRDYIIQHIDGLPKAQVHPDDKTLIRIKREAKKISSARKLDQDRMDFKEGFIWPSKGPITGVFGSQRVLNGEPRQPHYGIDIAAPIGTPVVAPAGGVVTYAEDMYFSGKTLVIDHGHNLSSSFLHLDKILVQVGDTVNQGEEIARVGDTGRVTGAHLDWRMNWHDQRIDPGLLMGESP